MKKIRINPSEETCCLLPAVIIAFLSFLIPVLNMGVDRVVIIIILIIVGVVAALLLRFIMPFLKMNKAFKKLFRF